jgi:hypothetical protein
MLVKEYAVPMGRMIWRIEDFTNIWCLTAPIAELDKELMMRYKQPHCLD